MMRISRDWLSEFIPIPYTPVELAGKLTMLGIEIEAIEDSGKILGQIVVGEVLEVSSHPNADKLRLAKVAVGPDLQLKIVCGAPNVRTGLKVAVARIGTDLGEGFVIKKSKIRGEVSEGMLCSERELGISERHEGIWELPSELNVGDRLSEALGQTDVVFEIGVTPNRADCLSHLGIAREIHVLTGEPVQLPKIAITSSEGELKSVVSIELPDPTLCPRYVAKLVRNVQVGPSPVWLKAKLETVGLRSISNVVDVTNLVLMECGHPLHAFDFGTVDSGKIVVRTAENFASEIRTLDGKVVKLPKEALLITDGEKPLGIAGIMGGEVSEIRNSTKDVLIESAYFRPNSIRRTSKQVGISSDASYRFERGTDINVLHYAVNRAAELIAELSGGTVVEGTIDNYPKPLPLKSFAFRPGRANMLIGMEIETQTMLSIFQKLEIAVDHSHPATWQLTAPSYRVDLECEEDAIEEIARVIGYDAIPLSTFEHSPLTATRNPLTLREFDSIIRNTLLSLGASECVSTPLVSKKEALGFHAEPVEIVNPLNIERNRMRSSVAINLLQACSLNERFGVHGQRLFEMGNIFHYSRRPEMLGKVREESQLAILLSGIQEDKTPYAAQAHKADLFLVKSAVEHVLHRIGINEFSFVTPESDSSASFLEAGEALAVVSADRQVGVIGRVAAAITKSYDIRQDCYIALLDHSRLYSSARELRLSPKHVQPIPKYPSVERDLALVLSSNVASADVITCIRTAANSAILKSVRIFDEFQSAEMKKSAERSLAFRLVFRSDDRTLEEREVDEVINLILKRLESELHARIRA